ncbi:MAG TPA: PilZ domain-containing protein [Candidatus Saccharimonadales bacterium]|nr:PilZ domain-containing protein [Candidatus Saccharimonadales bacterium]
MGTGRYSPLRSPRFAYRADLEIEWGSARLRGSTRDISSSGMYIQTPDTLWVGAGFTAHLKLDKTVKVDCYVKRVEPGRGMGVSLTVSESQHQEEFQNFLSTLANTSP